MPVKLKVLALAFPTRRTAPLVAVASISSMRLVLEKLSRPMSTAAVPAAATMLSTSPTPVPLSA